MLTDVDTPEPDASATASHGDPAAVAPAPAPDEPTTPDVPPTGPVSRRRWALRGFVIGLLVAGVAVVGAALVAILTQADGADRRAATFGVVMPDETEFRRVTTRLLAREQPRRLQGMTVVGAVGKVTVLEARGDRPSLLSSYLNPNALQVIARAIGLRSDERTVVRELRLEVLRSTGRQRWRLRGTQGGELWRATIAPNGTGLRLITRAGR